MSLYRNAEEHASSFVSREAQTFRYPTAKWLLADGLREGQTIRDQRVVFSSPTRPGSGSTTRTSTHTQWRVNT